MYKLNVAVVSSSRIQDIGHKICISSLSLSLTIHPLLRCHVEDILYVTFPFIISNYVVTEHAIIPEYVVIQRTGLVLEQQAQEYTNGLCWCLFIDFLQSRFSYYC